VRLIFKIVALFFCAQSFCLGQKLPPLYFKHLNSQNGLSDPNIRYLTTDHLGFLWIGTYNGLNRFDGKNCVAFYESPDDDLNLKGSLVAKILRSKDDNLWFGTSKGLSFYDYKRGAFNYFTFPEINNGNYYYASPFFISPDSTIWSNMAGGIYAIKNKVVKNISFQTSGKTFINQNWKDNIPWLLSPSSSKGIYMHYLDGFEVRKTIEYFSEKPAYKINEVYVASDSLVWLTSEKGLIALNPHSGQNTLYATKTSLSAIVPYKNLLFVGSNGEGLLVFDTEKLRFVGSYLHRSTNTGSISGNNVDKIFIDKDANLFVNILGKGLDYANLNPAAFEHILSVGESHDLGFDNTISSIKQLPDGEVWCSSKHSGILVYDSTLTKIKTHHLKEKGVNQMFLLGKTGLLIELKGFKYLLYSFKSKTFKPIDNRLLSLGVTSVSDENDSYLLTTPFGVIRLYKDSKMELLSYIGNQLEWLHTSHFFLISDKEALVQTYHTNLCLLEKIAGKFTVKKEVARTSFNILKSVKVGGLVYLATTEGLYVYNLQDQKLSDRPLIRAYCTDLLFDETLWVTSNTGIYNLDIKTGEIRSFSKYDGIQGTVFNSGTLIKLRNGKMAAAGSNGVNLFNPQNLKNETQKISTFITQIFINDVPFTAVNPITLKKLHLDYKSNTITFHVSPLDFRNSSAHKIHYQMVGYDPEPVEAAEILEVRYAKIPPGNYQFKVFVEGSLEPNVVEIKINPPFWLTTWFVVIAFLVVIGLVVLLTYLFGKWIKNNQLEKLRIMLHSQEEERKRIAIDLHDDLGGRLSSLKLFMQATQKNLTGESRESLKDTTKMLDEAIVELRNILFNLSPKSLDENGLEATLEDLAANVERITNMSIETNIETQETPIARQVQYAIYRICQELINNTLKHAKASEIFISLVRREDGLVLLYEDNGQGFSTDSAKAGYGLTNINTHAQAIFGELLIDSSLGKGTAVTLTIPPDAINFHSKSSPKP
jgi:signal transduction histidine kinase/ligand-binding sensor domain-containing protein